LDGLTSLLINALLATAMCCQVPTFQDNKTNHTFLQKAQTTRWNLGLILRAKEREIEARCANRFHIRGKGG